MAEIKSMKDLSQEFMMKYIDDKDSDFKAEFKKLALIKNKNGDVRYNAAAARHAFCKHFDEFKELLPKKKEKKTKTQIFEEW